MSDDGLAEAREAIREQREEIRAYLEGEGVDVSSWGDADVEPVPDGGQ
jgi:hypothetical protein